MRWKLIRRRLSVSAPRMIVRSHLPWPIRWAVAALVFGFSAALALWAFDFGKQFASIAADNIQLFMLTNHAGRNVALWRKKLEKNGQTS